MSLIPLRSTVRRQCVTVVIVTFFLSVSSSLSARSAGLPDFRGLIEDNAPAVVNISTKTDPEEREGSVFPNLPDEGPLREFFRHFFGDEGPEFGPRGFAPASSLGSGFIISKDGYVVSNHHVVNGADEVIVRLSDRREFEATIVGSDERSDIAILKIDTKEDLPVVRLGDSASLEVGEWVLAIGSPFGFDYSVTQGIVSALRRSLPRENYVPFIQTDVAINPGNSGGPLFNLNGEVIGVNSQIFSRTGGFMGLSFAIPMNVVVDVYEQIRATGAVSRGWLGVLIQDVDQQLAESFELDRPKGALVSRVLPDSPAEKAGLEVGDVILNFNGVEIVRSSDLPPVVGRTKAGDRVPVKVIRDGKTKSIKVLIGELPGDDALAAVSEGPGRTPKGTSDERINLTVAEITEEMREERDLDTDGVLVKDVQNGPAFDAGVRANDILLQIDNKVIDSPKRFREVMKGIDGGRAVAVLIQRQGGPMFLAMKVPPTDG